VEHIKKMRDILYEHQQNHKTALLLGLQDRVGAESSVHRADTGPLAGSRQALKIVFEFAFPKFVVENADAEPVAKGEERGEMVSV
jgi:hypothetical protein